MNQKAKDYIRRNTLDLESDNRMDSTGYVQYAISEAKAYAAIAIAEEGMRQKAIEAFKFAVYIMLSDGRYLPPKEAVQQCYNAFGIRVGLGDNWEDIYDGWNKEMK